jgi:hypothetical protein
MSRPWRSGTERHESWNAWLDQPFHLSFSGLVHVPDQTHLTHHADTDADLNARLDALCAHGWAIWERFEHSAGEPDFHPFVPADYDVVRAALTKLPARGRRFLEWGAASGIITMMADLLGFEAYGIELDASLIATARAVAAEHRSHARFVAGSFLPAGYEWRSQDGDTRTGTIGQGPSGYLQLGHALEDFDVVFAYPWDGEAPMMLDVMRRYGRHDALFLLYDTNLGVRVYRGGREVVEAP